MHPVSRRKLCWIAASPRTVEFFLKDHIKLLSERYDLTVVTNTDNPLFLESLDVPVRVVPMKIERDIVLLRDLMSLLQLILFFHRNNFDLVHSFSPKTGLLANFAAWICRVPIRLHTFQGEVWAIKKGFWRFVLKYLDRVVVFCTTNALVISRSEEQFLIAEDVVKYGQLRMLASGSIYGVDIKRFHPNSDQKTSIRKTLDIPESAQILLFVGRLTADKGVLDLACAFSRLTKRNSDLHLLFVGPDEQAMQSKIESICCDENRRVHFVPYSPVPESYMAASDILCLPSYREGFGLVLIEAAAVGLATVASRIYGITDAVLDGETGLLFHPRDIDDLVEKLSLLINDREYAQSLGQVGMERVMREFTKDHVLNEFQQYYADLLN